jgi:hypothetical protein
VSETPLASTARGPSAADGPAALLKSVVACMVQG